jgi:mRNA-degrading endonuclease RelE of RelBE toxin-antitoxin system
MPEVRFASSRIRSDLDSLEKQIRETIYNAIDKKLKTLSPFTSGIKKLHGSKNSRLRVGAYRVIFYRDSDGQVVIVGISNRKDAY